MSLQLTEQDFELLCRHLDGELAPQERIALQARIDGEPALSQELARIRDLDSQIRDTLVSTATVPESITALLRDSKAFGNVSPLAAATVTGSSEGTPSGATEPHSGDSSTARPPGSGNVLAFPGPAGQPGHQPKIRWPHALAASLVAGLGLLFMGDFSSSPPATLLSGNDRVLSAALDRESSGERWVDLNDGRELRPVLTFAHEDGRWCREYLLRGESSDWRAVACRSGEGWVTQAAGLESYLETADAYRPAGSGDAVPVAVFISQHAADIALGREEENGLIARGWR